MFYHYIFFLFSARFQSSKFKAILHIVVRYSLHIVIWDLVGYLGSPKQVINMLFENIEDGLE